MTAGLAVDLAAIAIAILVCVSIANRINVAYPIVLVLGGIALGYIPGLPVLQMPPGVVLLVFLPPLLYWESVTAPTSEFFSPSGLWWLLQLAFGLVVVTTLAVAAVAHFIDPAMAWGTALVFGAIVSSTDEVAFAPIVERIRIPRHVLATIESESLVNDATSLVLYGIGVTAVVTGTFSLPHAIGALAVSVVGGAAIGIAAALIAAGTWHLTKEPSLQSLISLITPYLAYLPAWYLGASGVLAAVAAGFAVTHFTPRVLTPQARLRVSGFWVTIVFMLNAFIFVYVGLQFHGIVSSLHAFSPLQLASYGLAVSATVIVVRLLWVFGQGLLPQTNEPEHEEGKADWSHVAVLAWSGMRGGVSLAAAIAIPLETAAGPFPERPLIIFLTFCVLLATLIGQGGTLPALLRLLDVRDDGEDVREERATLAHTAKAALKRLDEMSRDGELSPELYKFMRTRFASRWTEFTVVQKDGTAHDSDVYRHVSRELLEAQRDSLIRLQRERKADNTVLRRIQRLLDLENEEIDMLESAGHPDIEE
jgi:CPA1 family monovalent cation:H+ antiporter